MRKRGKSEDGCFPGGFVAAKKGDPALNHRAALNTACEASLDFITRKDSISRTTLPEINEPPEEICGAEDSCCFYNNYGIIIQ